MLNTKNKLFYTLFLVYSIVFLGIFFSCNGTGDSGDSIMHYLYAKYALHQHQLYFHHWAKPFFVLIASPFCQFGFKGVQVMNLLCALGTLIYTYKLAVKLNLKLPWIAVFIVITSPINYQLTLTGLTEPLFGFLLLLSFYYLDRWMLISLIIISFLPFVRSEGIIISGSVFLYLLYDKKYKYIPILAFGHIVYALLGYSYYQDILWVFNKIPYIGFHSNYGNGNLIHFVKSMHKIIGFSNAILLGISVLFLMKKTYDAFKKKISLNGSNLEILIIVTSVLFFLFHSIAWAFGWFNSFGLLRVLIPIIPFFAIIVNRFLENIVSNIKLILIFFTVTLCITCLDQFIFKIDKYNLDISQVVNLKSYSYIVANKLNTHKIYTHAPYLKVLINKNPFLNEFSKEDLHSFKLKQGDILVWDDWYSRIDNWIQKEDLDSNTQFRLLKVISKEESKGDFRTNRIYIKL